MAKWLNVMALTGSRGFKPGSGMGWRHTLNRCCANKKQLMGYKGRRNSKKKSRALNLRLFCFYF